MTLTQKKEFSLWLIVVAGGTYNKILWADPPDQFRGGELWGPEVPDFCCCVLIFSFVIISTDIFETNRIDGYYSKEQEGIFAEFSVDSLLQK